MNPASLCRPLAHCGAVLALGLMATTPALAAERHVFDSDHTEIRFSWDHMGFSTTSAHFRGVDGALAFDEDEPTASEIEVTIDIASLDTGREDFTEHLLSDDFFDVDTHPEARFVSSEIRARGENQYEVDGELTLHGTTRDVTLDVTINRIGENPLSEARTIGLDASTVVSRSAFGMGRYTPMVGDEVTIDISAEMPREADLD